MLRHAFALLAALAALAAAPALASASGVAYPDADWTEATIESPSAEAGTANLHADILRPKGATDATKTPVILSIGPYFNHSGQTGAGRTRRGNAVTTRSGPTRARPSASRTSSRARAC